MVKEKNPLAGLAFPLELTDKGKFRIREVDVREGNYEKIEENIRQIIMTRPGQRAMRPEFGGHYFKVFALNDPSRRALRAYRIKRAIERWEPRVQVANITPQEPTPEEQERGIARTKLEIVINQERLTTEIKVDGEERDVEIEFPHHKAAGG